MQYRITLAALLACAAMTGARAEPGPHDGRWTVRFEAFGQARQAILDIQGPTGSWQLLYVPSGADVCFRLKSPIEVLEVTSEQISLVVRRSKALAGCTDARPLSLKRTSDQLLQGSFSDGTQVRAER